MSMPKDRGRAAGNDQGSILGLDLRFREKGLFTRKMLNLRYIFFVVQIT